MPRFRPYVRISTIQLSQRAGSALILVRQDMCIRVMAMNVAMALVEPGLVGRLEGD